MTRIGKRENSNWIALFDLLACMGGFGAALFFEKLRMDPVAWSHSGPWFLPWAVSALVAWIVMVYPERQWHEGVRLWVDGVLATMGTTLLAQCALAYLFRVQPASKSLIVIGSACSVILTLGLRGLVEPRLKSSRKGSLLVGFDGNTSCLASAVGENVIGGIRTSSTIAPPEVEVLGDIDHLEEICAERNPSSIILGSGAEEIPLRKLLNLHYSGVEMEGTAAVYERVAQRVAWGQLPPADLLFYLNPNTSPAMLAFQAVYKNLLGLTLRLIFAPLLILTSLLIVVFTGGPPLEHIECLGFRRIPFQMLRFRIYRADGTPSRIGMLIDRLHLTNLPQLVNVVRGEMTLFGPAPVRTVFAQRLCDLIPAHAYRYTLKPGIFGWPDAVLERKNELADESDLLELDLYYVKQESPSLDLDILLRVLFRRSTPKTEPVPMTNAARNC
jgi:lipopolysaccharide/colanic/teichoic acid biosynthesis glycosyltransferase